MLHQYDFLGLLRAAGYPAVADGLAQAIQDHPEMVTVYPTTSDHLFDVRSYPTPQDAVNAAHPGGTVFLPVGQTVGVMDLAGKNIGIVGAGPSAELVAPPNFVGPVLNMTGYKGPGSFRAKQVIRDFSIVGNGEINPANVGLDMHNCHPVAMSNVAIRNTGGPCWTAGAIGLGTFRDMTMFRPLDAGINNTSYVVFDDWVNGCLIEGLGFRSETADLDGQAIWKIQSASEYQPHDSTISGCWLEYPHIPDGGAAWDFATAGWRIETPQLFDGSIGSGSAWVRFRGGGAGGNYLWGNIPGTENATDRWGVDLLQSRNAVSGVKGYNGPSVRFGPGVEFCGVHFIGRFSGVNSLGFVDASGNTTNTVIDQTLGTFYGF